MKRAVTQATYRGHLQGIGRDCLDLLTEVLSGVTTTPRSWRTIVLAIYDKHNAIGLKLENFVEVLEAAGEE